MTVFFEGSRRFSKPSLSTLQPSHLPSSTPQAISFNNKGFFVESPKKLPLIADVFKGNVLGTQQLFFPVRRNQETELIDQVVRGIIESNSKLASHFDAKKNDYVIKFKDLTFNLYETLRKVKWDLITFENSLLDKLGKQSEFAHVPTCNNSQKAYLYTKLHDAEKREIGEYSSYSSTYNSFLRDPVDRHMDVETITATLRRVAVLCSGLNKIPESKAVQKSGYVYRCISNVSDSQNGDLIDQYRNRLSDHQKYKDYGFTGVSYNRPLQGFLSSGPNRDCVKIFLNPTKLAKDISGLSYYPGENECLFLPNTKSEFLREVFYQKDSSSGDNSKRYLFLTKLISKRQQVL